MGEAMMRLVKMWILKVTLKKEEKETRIESNDSLSKVDKSTVSEKDESIEVSGDKSTASESEKVKSKEGSGDFETIEINGHDCEVIEKETDEDSKLDEDTEKEKSKDSS